MPREIGPFRKPERELTTFDYVDIAQGKSVVVFYGGLCRSGSTEYHISSAKFWSGNKITESDHNGTPKTITFDIGMTFPKTVSGATVVNIPFGMNNGNAVARTVDLESVKVSKIALGGAETTLDDVSGGRFVSPAVAGFYYQTAAPRISLATTQFKKGEILRLSVTVRMWGQSGDHGLIGHDPKNRGLPGDSSSTSSMLQFPVPFKIFR